MLRGCPYCHKIHDSKFSCGMKQKEYKKYSEADKFRKSTAWIKKREQIRERDLNICQACIRELRGTLIKYNSKDLSVHHAIAIEDDYGRRLDDDNLLTLCAMHHSMAEKKIIPFKIIKKIIDEQNERIGHCAPDGYPPGSL